jgi:hypothetical protein
VHVSELQPAMLEAEATDSESAGDFFKLSCTQVSTVGPDHACILRLVRVAVHMPVPDLA